MYILKRTKKLIDGDKACAERVKELNAIKERPAIKERVPLGQDKQLSF